MRNYGKLVKIALCGGALALACSGSALADETVRIGGGAAPM